MTLLRVSGSRDECHFADSMKAQWMGDRRQRPWHSEATEPVATKAHELQVSVFMSLGAS